MSDEDQEFQQRWGFRRNDSDMDSLSDDHSGPEDHKQPNHSSQKQEEREFRSRRTKRRASNYEYSNAGLTDLSGYMESLVEGIKVARVDMLKWMNKEMERSFKEDVVSANPSGKGKGNRRGRKDTQNAKRSTTPRTNNPNRGKRKAGGNGMTRNQENGVLEKEGKEKRNEVVVGLPNVPQVVAAVDTIPVEKTEKQKDKGNRIGMEMGMATKKQKTAYVSDQQIDKAAAAVATAPNYLTLPTVLTKRPSIDGNERENGMRNGMNSGMNSSSQMGTFVPRVQQKDGVFTQNGLKNGNDDEQFRGLMSRNVMGNGNGNGYPFSLGGQGLSGGMGMQIPNPSQQLGMQQMQYLTQQMPGMRMNAAGGAARMPPNRGNQLFMESYGGLNQHLRFTAEGGVMAFKHPDNRGVFLQPR